MVVDVPHDTQPLAGVEGAALAGCGLLEVMKYLRRLCCPGPRLWLTSNHKGFSVRRDGHWDGVRANLCSLQQRPGQRRSPRPPANLALPPLPHGPPITSRLLKSREKHSILSYLVYHLFFWKTEQMKRTGRLASTGLRI
ncbi:unnamed protein product [Gadus morhua 'NCC']